MTDESAQGRTYSELDEALNWSCGYGEFPTSLPCMDPAVWHGLIQEGSRITAAMSCCDQHRPIMALSATWIHRMDSACFLPGSCFIWPENECVMPDGEGCLPALTEASDLHAAVSS